jgi:hypothetical protein
VNASLAASGTPSCGMSSSPPEILACHSSSMLAH